jgi:hypothetical protein
MVWMGGVIGAVGVVFVALGVQVIVSRRLWVSRARKAAGRIIRHRDLGGTSVQVIGFVTDDGRYLEMESNVRVREFHRYGSMAEWHRQDMAKEIGEVVSISYDPLNKQRAFVAGTSSGGVGIIFFGAVWLAFGALLLSLATA